jgi:flavodoxin
MKALVVYDSAFGNTEKIAQAIAHGLGLEKENGIVRAGAVQPEHLTGLTLLIVGSPTQKFRPTQATSDFLKNIPKNGLKGVKVAAFDTRFTVRKIEEVRILALFVRMFGYAAKPITNKLETKGGERIASPEGFYVSDTKGPLLEGELERAADWAAHIKASL